VNLQAPSIALTGATNINGNTGVSGNLSVTGNITGGTVNAATVCSTSDARYKRNVKELSGVLNRINAIRGVTYQWRTEAFPDKGFTRGRQIGIIAQEVEKSFPELIIADEKGYKNLDYMRFSAVLLEAIKEQQKQINVLKNEISDLKKTNER
jgi:hypothetical protein